ncbi:MAG: hypothetical protein IKK49_08605 [Clostridia bacterium]|nr:hypothetical protein [Clostridia bacterium]
MMTISILAILINTPCYIYQDLLAKGIDLTAIHQPYHEFMKWVFRALGADI